MKCSKISGRNRSVEHSDLARIQQIRGHQYDITGKRKNKVSQLKRLKATELSIIWTSLHEKRLIFVSWKNFSTTDPTENAGCTIKKCKLQAWKNSQNLSVL